MGVSGDSILDPLRSHTVQKQQSVISLLSQGKHLMTPQVTAKVPYLTDKQAASITAEIDALDKLRGRNLIAEPASTGCDMALSDHRHGRYGLSRRGQNMRF